MFSLAILSLVATVVRIQAQGPLIPANCDRFLTVTAGETCTRISAQYNVSTYQLALANPQINEGCTNLFVNEYLCLGFSGQDCNTTYVVQSGNTCDAIASQFKIPEATLLVNNQNVNQDCTNLLVHEVLCVSSTIYPYNSTSSS